MSTVPIFAPDGSLGEVQRERAQEAVSAGGKLAVSMVSPDGQVGFIPHDRFAEAAKAGAVPYQSSSPVPIPAGLQGPTPKLGSSMADTLSAVGSHAANIFAGPYHAIADAPTPEEQSTYGPGINRPLARISLAADRAFVRPTTTALSKISKGNTFDENANHVMDAIPLIGPWARQVEDETAQKGAVAGMAGLATDVVAPQGIAKIGGAGLRGAGFVSRLASTTPEARTLAATRKIVPGSPGELLTRALKPSVSYPDFEESVNKTLPAILDRSPQPGIAGYANAANDAAAAEHSWYDSKIAPYRKSLGVGTAPRPSTISGAPIARAQMNSIPVTNLIEDPSKAMGPIRRISSDPEGPVTIGGQSIRPGIEARTADKAANWNRDFDVPTLDAARQDLNAKLDSFWNQSGGNKAAARSNPEVARTEAASNATRDVLYQKLAQDYGIPESSIRDQQNLYGHLSDVAEVAGKRATVYGRQNPLSLQETLAATPGHPVTGAIDFIGQRLLKNATGSDALVNSALDRQLHPIRTPLPARQGLLPNVFNLTGDAAERAGTKLMNGNQPNPFFLGSRIQNEDRKNGR